MALFDRTGSCRARPLKALSLAFVATLTLGVGACSKHSSPSDPVTPVDPVPAAKPKNVIFFLGDGMGMATLTAARIYSVGEDGELPIDTLPETAFVRTFSNDAQVTDSAPSMAAYMTGVKMNNEVISMSTDTKAITPNMTTYTGNCGTGNGQAVKTMLEYAKANGMGTGVVTTTRVTHATPADTYAHVCHRDAESDIAAQLVPNGAGYNGALKDGVDVVLGGGRDFFLPTAGGGKRADGRDLTDEMGKAGYRYVTTGTDFASVEPSSTSKLFGLFTPSHMDFDLDRVKAKKDQPSLADMTGKALDIVSKNSNGYFLMVEGGRIDHALHNTNAKRALQDTVAFNDAIKVALDKAQKLDPNLENTLIVVTADHDHTLVLNGYSQRTGKTTPTNAGVLGVLKSYVDGKPSTDLDGAPYTTIGFGNGENRINNANGRASLATTLNDDVAGGDDYHQEAAVQTAAGSETHGGTDVFLGATGSGADTFHGSLENIQVFNLICNAVGWCKP